VVGRIGRRLWLQVAPPASGVRHFGL